MNKSIAVFIIYFCFSTLSQAQLFIDDGTNGSLYIRNPSGGALATSEAVSTNVALYVDGNITIEGARLLRSSINMCVRSGLFNNLSCGVIT